MRNIADEQRSGHTSYYARFGESFGGPIIPFGAEVPYKPITDKDIVRLHKFGSKMLSGVFVGYEQRAGSGWSGNLLIVDWDEIENTDAVCDIYPKTINAEEVQPILLSGKFRFPIAEGALCQPDAGGKSKRGRKFGSNASAGREPRSDTEDDPRTDDADTVFWGCFGDF